MEKINNFWAIIPARLASTRLPNKVLLEIQGKPMFWHTYTQVKKVVPRVYLACDSDLVANKAEELAVPYIMTSVEHQSGSDRVFEAAKKLNCQQDDIIINVQADEPLIEPKSILSLMELFENPKIQIASLAYKISEQEAGNPNLVKVLLSANKRALYFSRSQVPYVRNNVNVQYYGHLGLYAYTLQVLEKFISLEQSNLELVESLEQLRFLENDLDIYMALTEARTKGVDCQEDLDYVRKILES